MVTRGRIHAATCIALCVAGVRRFGRGEVREGAALFDDAERYADKALAWADWFPVK